MKLIEQHAPPGLLQHARPCRADLPETVVGQRPVAADRDPPRQPGGRSTRRIEGAMADGKVRALVATASLDLGIDWGDIDLVIQMGAPKGSSRLLQRIGRANHRLDEPSRDDRPRQPLRISGGPAALTRSTTANSISFRHARRPCPACPGGCLRRTFRRGRASCRDPLRRALRGIKDETFREILNFVATGGYALRAYDRFRRIVEGSPGRWRLAKPAIAQQHRMNAGVIVEQPLLDVRFKGGRKLGTVEEGFGSTLPPATISSSPGSASKSSGSRTPTSSSRHRRRRRGSLPTAASACRCRPISPTASGNAGRSQRLAPLPRRRQRMARGAVGALAPAGTAPAAGRNLPARRPPLHGRLQLRGLERAPVARHAADQADGECRPEAARLRRQRLWLRLLRPRADHRPAIFVLARHPRTRIRRMGRTRPSCSRAPFARSP